MPPKKSRFLGKLAVRGPFFATRPVCTHLKSCCMDSASNQVSEKVIWRLGNTPMWRFPPLISPKPDGPPKIPLFRETGTFFATRPFCTHLKSCCMDSASKQVSKKVIWRLGNTPMWWFPPLISPKPDGPQKIPLFRETGPFFVTGPFCTHLKSCCMDSASNQVSKKVIWRLGNTPMWWFPPLISPKLDGPQKIPLFRETGGKGAFFCNKTFLHPFEVLLHGFREQPSLQKGYLETW